VKEYGTGYYTKHAERMKVGYVHPYHTTTNPIVFSNLHYYKILADAVGPEQVSPHYESLSRSRRGLLFVLAYTGMIVNVSKMGGWNNNEWIRGMLLHQEFIIALYLGFVEIRHFMFFLGPKFSIWYDTYSEYETQ
jgi:hypothetical protein